MNYRLICSAFVVFISGCGSLPDLKVGYYLPKTSTDISINQSVACKNTGDKNTSKWISYTNSIVSYKTITSADITAYREIDLNELSAWYGKTDIGFDFTEDGVVTGVNASTEGRLGGYLTEALEIFGIARPASADKSLVDDRHPCEIVAQFSRAKAGKDEEVPIVISVELVGRAHFDDNPINFSVVNMHPSLYELIIPILGRVSAEYQVLDSGEQPQKRFVYGRFSGNDPLLAFRTPKKVLLTTEISKPESRSLNTAPVIKKTTVGVLQKGEEYFLPIQKPPLFGSNSVEIKTANGQVTHIKYTGDPADSALGSLSDAFRGYATSEKTDSERASEIKAKADIIYQNERLTACTVDPSNCTES